MATPQNYLAVIKVVGIGGGGVNAINRMIEFGLKGVEFVAINTDAQQLLMSDADVKLDIGREITKGLGAGANPEVGRQAAEDHAAEIEEVLRGSDMVFITANPSSLASASTSSSRSAIVCLSTRSVFVIAAIFGVRFIAAMALAMKRSPAPIGSLAGIHSTIASTSDQVSYTNSFSRSPRSVRGLCTPGVSTSTNCPSGRCTNPRIVCLVVCGLSEVIATFDPTSAFVSVDLPAFGRPTRHAKPALCMRRTGCRCWRDGGRRQGCSGTVH